jgi:hypothetical protein
MAIEPKYRVSTTRDRPEPGFGGAELFIHGGDLRHRWTVVIMHDQQP